LVIVNKIQGIKHVLSVILFQSLKNLNKKPNIPV
jgi:hypothetical protein